MHIVWIIALVWLLGCRIGDQEHDVALPRVPPDAVVVSWSVVSRSSNRDSLHAVLDASRKLTTTTRAPDGTMMSISRTVSKKEYATLIDRLRTLDCCSLESTRSPRSDPAEAKPLLEIDLGDTRCEVERWDREWRKGLARECGFAVARMHRAGFVPDSLVDDSSP
jgi:hypothetical protein